MTIPYCCVEVAVEVAVTTGVEDAIVGVVVPIVIEVVVPVVVEVEVEVDEVEVELVAVRAAILSIRTLSCAWSAAMSAELSVVDEPLRAARVFGPTLPTASIPCAFWYAFTAAKVIEPK
jgi:hypothetical protein